MSPPDYGGKIDWHTFWDEDEDQSDFLLEPIFAVGCGHSIYADSGAGKSYVMLYLTAALATGRACLGRDAGEPIDVLYFDYEMRPSSVREFLSEFGYGANDDLSHLHVYQLPELDPFDTIEGGTQVLELAAQLRAKIVVIDTLSRVLAGEENSAETMRDFHRYTGAPLRERDIAYVRLDHTGKDSSKGQRGSSAKKADLDVAWFTSKTENDGQRFRATKRRLAWLPEEIHLVKRENNGVVSFEMVEESYPEGTAEIAALLDRLGVPKDAGRPACREALRAAGEHVRNAPLGHAIRWRKRAWGR